MVSKSGIEPVNGIATTQKSSSCEFLLSLMIHSNYSFTVNFFVEVVYLILGFLMTLVSCMLTENVQG